MPRKLGSPTGSESGDQQEEVGHGGHGGKGGPEMNKAVLRQWNGKGRKIVLCLRQTFPGLGPDIC